MRAGVRDEEKAKSSLDVAVKYGILTAEQLKRVTIVTFDITQPETIAPAIGNANKVSMPGPAAPYKQGTQTCRHAKRRTAMMLQRRPHACMRGAKGVPMIG